jgi:PAS domain S-box-containing protein
MPPQVDSALGRPALETWTDARAFLGGIFAGILAGGPPAVDADRPVPLRRPGGGVEERYFTYTFSPIHDAAGAVGGIFHRVAETTARILAERRRDAAEAALRASEARYRAFVVNSTEGVYRLEFDPPVDTALPPDEQVARVYRAGRFAECNDAFARMYGFARPDEIVGRGLDLMLPPGDPAARAYLRGVIAAGYRAADVESAERDRAGRRVYFANTVTGVVEAGALVRAWGIQRDITERKLAEAERERLLAAAHAARAAAEEAVRARDTFLSIAAHELRTPVTALKGTAQVLRRRQARGQLDPARLAAGLGALERSAGRLAALTDDLLDVSRLRTGQLPLDPRPTDLAALVAEAVAQARDRAGDAHRLGLDIGAGLPAALADPERIEQVLTNLLDNALKYSPDGGEIAVTVRADGAGVAVAVRDAGIGLPPGAAETIFAPFGRAANAAASGLPGMGLGLFICRTIAERHGGRIAAASPGEGRGTTVTLWLPAAAAADTTGGAGGAG